MLGIAAIFDLTGVAVFRLLRNSLPGAAGPAQRSLDAGAFAAATAEIQSAYREVMMHAGDDTGGVTLTAWPTTTTPAESGGRLIPGSLSGSRPGSPAGRMMTHRPAVPGRP
jgi:hypothetical protein